MTDAGGTTRGQAHAWLVVLILSFANIVSFVDRLIMSLMVDPIKRDLALSDTQVSWLLGMAFVLFYAVTALPIAAVADRYNRKWLIFVGVALWTAATALCAAARSFWTLFLCRMNVGIGEAALAPATMSMIADLFPRDRLARPVSVFSAAGYMGGGIALLLGGAVVQMVKTVGEVTVPVLGTIQSWQLTFLIVAAPGLLVLALVAFIREPARGATSPAGADGSATPATSASYADLGRHMRRHWRAYAAIFAGFSVLATLGYGTFMWVPTFFTRIHGWSYAQAGYVYGLIVLVFGTAGVLAGGWITDRLLKRGVADANLRVALGSALLLLPFAAGFPLVPSEAGAVALLVPAAMLSSMPFGVGLASLPPITPNAMRAKVTAIYLFVANVVSLGFGPVLVATLTDKVFGREDAIHHSLATVAILAVCLGALALLSGLRPYREAVAAQPA
ncbi:MAG: MFS transporter [Sphingomonadales bacterium]